MSFRLDETAWSSPWRRYAVADKAVPALGTLAAVLLLPAWPATPVVVAGLTAVALIAARVRPGAWLAAVAAPLVFVLVGAASVAVQVGARPWVSAESVHQALTVLGRGSAGACALILLAATTPMVDLLDAMRRLRIPAPLLDIAALMYRLVFVVWDSAATIREAQAGRLGYSTARASRHSFGALGAGLLVRSWRRARRLEDGMAGRGYDGDIRTLPTPRDHSPLLLVASGAWLAGLVTVGVLG